MKKKSVLLSALALLLPAITYCWLNSSLPESYYKQAYSSVLYNQQGQLLAATIAADEQWRLPPESKLPEKYIQALLLYEDKHFYRHWGLDPGALLRAIKLNIQQRRIVSGASTLSMQLARMLYGNQKRSYLQKFKELLLTFKLEYQLSKDELLIHYASLAPFGGNTVGIGAANWRYFSLPLTELSWSQAALLAVLPNNPAAIHPGRRRQALKNKRDKLLEQLHRHGHIDQLELKLAKLEALPEKPQPMPRSAALLLQSLKQTQPKQQRFISYIDSNLQQQLHKLTASYNRQMQADNINNMAVLVIDDRQQEVIAYIGNATLGTQQRHAAKLDLIQRPRSSGSVFKPFLFAQMLEQGLLLPETLVEDIPSYYDGYNPKNYDRSYRGLVPAKHALSQSLNVPAVRMLKNYGVSQFKQDLQQLGFSHLWRPAQDYGLALILGGAETSLWDVANAYSRMNLSAQGRRLSFNKARLSSSDTPKKNEFLLSQGSAWLTQQALLEVNRPGVAGSWQEFRSSQDIAWKTGTSYGWHDAWAIGSNGRYTVAVWAGNANGEEARALSGSRSAAPLMFDIFSYLPVVELAAEPLHALKSYRVCRNDGHLPQNNCETYKQYAPEGAQQFRLSSRYHELIYIDKQSGFRVHGLCEKSYNMKSQSYFSLPPVTAYYYRAAGGHLPALPPWRKDCLKSLAQSGNQAAFDIEYPSEGARLKIPVELNGQLGRVILRARHLEASATLYWQIDKQSLPKTKHFHEHAVALNPGWHQLTVIDEHGRSQSRWFKVN
ncbi:penicillin-binding protein 1C [Agaribacterium haliotis]|uniref:penicillin-binding protein 1C n=1 Tax=Agaribacterium haliotis TaxID=2013869 RepID=UPI000BB59E95|nr:penicillin-binding protein 1C [Agaribacterium haliotis]